MTQILFVDDDAFVARIYSQRLVEQGFEVVVAEDGLAAIKRLSDFKPDLVVLDLLMPKMSGADVLKYMRQRPELKSTPVIVFSNAFLTDLVEQVVAAGTVEESLVKEAVTPALLIETIRRILSNPRPTPALERSETPAEVVQKPSLTLPEPTPPATPPAPTRAVSAEEDEAKFQERVRREFVERTPIILNSLRRICQEFLEAADSQAETRRLEDLSRKVGFLTQMTGMAGYDRLAQLSSALEALLFHLQEKPEKITDSCRYTLASTVAFLANRLDSREQPQAGPTAQPAVLIVDDDAVSNRALARALARAQLLVTSVTDPFEALKSLRETPYDLLLLDISMPGIDGIELCERMHALPSHKRTPVIFITSYGDFKTRLRSILSGGEDLITKPVFPAELTVKVITHLLQQQRAA